jgi:toxin ParE1/3/4
MYSVYKKKLAEKDLIDIWVFTYNQWGEAKADSYLDELEESFNLIAENPYIGTANNDIRKGYRQYHANRHIIFYVINNETINIIRVLYDQVNFIKYFS